MNTNKETIEAKSKQLVYLGLTNGHACVALNGLVVYERDQELKMESPAVVAKRLSEALGIPVTEIFIKEAMDGKPDWQTLIRSMDIPAPKPIRILLDMDGGLINNIMVDSDLKFEAVITDQDIDGSDEGSIVAIDGDDHYIRYESVIFRPEYVAQVFDIAQVELS